MTSVEITPAATAAQSKIGLTGKTVAIELRDNCLGAMVDGWLAYFDDTRSPVTDDHIGQLCIVARLILGTFFSEQLFAPTGRADLICNRTMSLRLLQQRFYGRRE